MDNMLDRIYTLFQLADMELVKTNHHLRSPMERNLALGLLGDAIIDNEPEKVVMLVSGLLNSTESAQLRLALCDMATRILPKSYTPLLEGVYAYCCFSTVRDDLPAHLEIQLAVAMTVLEVKVIDDFSMLLQSFANYTNIMEDKNVPMLEEITRTDSNPALKVAAGVVLWKKDTSAWMKSQGPLLFCSRASLAFGVELVPLLTTRRVLWDNVE